MNETLLLVFIVAMFPLCWLLLVSGVLYLTSFMGWRALAEKYSNTGEPPAIAYSFASAQTSFLGRYNNCMNIGLSARGLFLQPFLLFRFAHPALLLPWGMLKSAQEKSWIFSKVAELRFDDGARSAVVYAPPGILKNPYLQSAVRPPA